MFSILTVSRNTRLLLERNDTLALAGFRVISPRTPEETPFLALERNVQAVIIGHSVEPRVRKVIIEAVRKLCPDCVIVFVYVQPHLHGESLADLSVDVSHGNEPLIRALQARLPQSDAAD